MLADSAWRPLYKIGGIAALAAAILFRHNCVSPSVSPRTLIFIPFWDGSFQALDAKDGVGMLINLGVLLVILVLKWRP